MLRRQLREKERSEMELKRRLLESDAEIKVWKSKYEQRPPPQLIEIR
jgi:hypothetical protein